jgi:hypothetical protein
MNLVTIIGYLAAFGTTASFLPQAVKTIQTKDTFGHISADVYPVYDRYAFMAYLRGNGAQPAGSRSQCDYADIRERDINL